MYDEILQELKADLENIARAGVRVIIFGSRARGDYEEGSDIDIAIIVSGLTRELKNSILDLVAGIELKYLTPLSALVISETDFEFLKKKERRIALDIDREGIPV